ncbi:MAG: type IV toxin-antitoxin system AbiEi family antitoxin domain-containing protein [Phascolarctobacterium sp.]|nr:type IV toxin-antitoxin system AbiEi family antitoxin domain-containing protein [Phascolarctobacterium sp.]
MTISEKLDLLLQENKGVIRTSDAVAAGVSRVSFYEYVKERELEKVFQGTFVSKDAWIDSMYLVSLRYSQAIFSHDTALYLHNLTDREPLQYSVTVKSGYNNTKLLEANLKPYNIKKDLFELGKTTILTPFGNVVAVYDRERTICDILRSRNKIEVQTFQEAIKGYFQSSDKNLRLLWKYAKIFKVEKLLSKYTEVLL